MYKSMAGKASIVIALGKGNQTYTKVVSPNNKTLSHSETFKTKAGAENNAAALKKVIPNAIIVNKTKKSV